MGSRVVSCRIEVRVVPGSKETALVGRYRTGWKVRIHAAPEKGKANDELVAWLAKLLGVSRSQVTVVRGATSRDKVLAIEDVLETTVNEVLNANLR